MQGKGLIKIFLVLLVLVTLMQIFYMLPTRNVEKNAVRYAEQVAPNDYELQKQARANYLDSMSGEEIFSIPMLSSYTYDDLKKRQLALGLDLKGGMSTVLQVDLKDLLLRLSGNSRDEQFRTALDAAEKAQESSQSDFISLFAQEYQKIGSDGKLTRIFMRDPILREELNIESSNGEVIQLLRENADQTVDLTFKRLKQRIDKLGVTQPNVSLDESRDLILVEMPGIDNPERARSFLQASAALEFWDTYRVNDQGILGAVREADKKLGMDQNGEVEEAPAKFDTIWTKLDSLGQETGDSTSQIIERAADPFASQGPLLSKLNLNGATGQLTSPQTVIGTAPRSQKKNIMKMLEREDIKSLFPADAMFRWSKNEATNYETGESTGEYELYLIKKLPGSDKPPLEGDCIINAGSAPNSTGEMAVNLRMNSQGSKKWAEMTEKAANAGNREVGIVLDDEVVSAPSVRTPITGGSTEITGSFSVQEAADLASILEVGKLPAKTRIIQESTVGPSLGSKNINSSMLALAIGMALVLLFMIAYYGGAGIVSIIALLLNLFFIFGALASFGTVLTLPGIAGIVLTVGMAVDANVIIYERVREELLAGKTLRASIVDGFRNSYSAIIDANVTTLLTAAVLAYFGLGPIKGFAVVLIIGVLCSLFTAVLIGRMIIDWWVGKDNNLTFFTGWSKGMFSNLNINWLGKRKIAYMISGTIIVLGLISMFTRGFDLGVDFKGGYSYNIEFVEGSNVSASDLRKGLSDHFGVSTTVKAVDTDNTFNVVTSYLINDSSEDTAERVIAKLHEGVVALTGIEIPYDKFKLTDSQNVTHVTQSSKVGPTIADDIIKSSWYAGIFALLLIFLYLFLRFNKWQFSLGAVAALFHDSLVVLGLFSLLWNIVPFSLEIDQAFIAALLTVIGYSINDTVVVFDRIREDLGIYTQENTDDVINRAINSTFSRTIITSLTTLFMVLMLFIFGSGSIKAFAFALLIGIIVGTYSSIFVATPIVRDLTTNLRTAKTEKKKRFSKALN